MRWRVDIYKVNDIISYMAIVNDNDECIMPVEMFDSRFIDELVDEHNKSISKAMNYGAEIVKDVMKEIKQDKINKKER